MKFEAEHDGTEWLVVIMPYRSERAVALDQDNRRRARVPQLSPVAQEKISVPTFRRLVEQLAVLSVSEISAVEHLLRAFAPVGMSPHAGFIEASSNGSVA